ncbi:MAG: carboxypeptidase regulatory-like domain-containing protein [Planctomycetota bacterium]
MRPSEKAIHCRSRIAITLLTLILVATVDKSGGEAANRIICSGAVVDARDRPVADAKVTLYVRQHVTGDYPYAVSWAGISTTSANGAFSFNQGVPSDSRRSGYIVAEKKGMAMGFGNWNMRPGSKELEIKLSQPKELAGIVVDENDRPVSGAEVSITHLLVSSRYDRQSLSGRPAMDMFTSTTDRAGRFRFTHMPADATAEFLLKKAGRATVSTYGRTRSTGRKLTYAPGQTGIRLTLPPEARIEGTAVEAGSGKPVAGVEVVVRRRQLSRLFRRKPVSTDANGKFSIGTLVSETYVLEVVQPSEGLADWVARPLQVTTEAGKTKGGIEVELHRGGLLEVVVTEAINKGPVEKARVRIRQKARAKYFYASSDEDGIASIRLMPGEYRIMSISKPNYSYRIIEEIIRIEDGKTARAERQLTAHPRIAGVVRDEKGNPVQGAKLQVWPMGTGRDNSSDADGKFEFSWEASDWGNDPPPTLLLLGRYEQGNLAAAVPIKENTRTKDITLRPALAVAGRVVDPNGKGIANANIMPWLLGLPLEDMLPTVGVGKDGRFEIRALPAGYRYSLDVMAQGYAESFGIEINADEAVDNKLDVGYVTLAAANLSVSGVVVHNGRPVVGATVSCHGSGSLVPTTRTGGDGKFTFDEVRAGKLQLSASKSGATRLHGSVETEGGATDVKIEMKQLPSAARYFPERPLSLVGKPLPDLKDVRLDLPPADLSGKMLLVCFFDMKLTLSAECLRQVDTMAKTLATQNVVVVAVQASKTEERSLQDWCKRYGISIPIGMGPGRCKTLPLACAVTSLAYPD